MKQTGEVRKEDLGKMLFKDAPVMAQHFVELESKKFFDEVKADFYLLYSRELSYFTTFEKKSTTPEMLFSHFLQESYYQDLTSEEYVGLDKITFMEYNKDIRVLEFYVKDKYFQVMPWTMEEL